MYLQCGFGSVGRDRGDLIFLPLPYHSSPSIKPAGTITGDFGSVSAGRRRGRRTALLEGRGPAGSGADARPQKAEALPAEALPGEALPDARAPRTRRREEVAARLWMWPRARRCRTRGREEVVSPYPCPWSSRQRPCPCPCPCPWSSRQRPWRGAPIQAARPSSAGWRRQASAPGRPCGRITDGGVSISATLPPGPRLELCCPTRSNARATWGEDLGR